MRSFNKYTPALFLFFFILSGCESLDIRNENDSEALFSNPDAVRELTGSLFNTWFLGTQAYEGPALMLWVAADAGTCSQGNEAVEAMIMEPRVEFDNTCTGTCSDFSESFYKSMYSILYSSSMVIRKIKKDGMTISNDDGTDQTTVTEAMAYLCQGLALGYIGLVYDKAYVVTEYTDTDSKISLSSYKNAVDTAISRIEKCISICESESFTLPVSWIPGMTYTHEQLGQLARSMAARLMSYSPRNKSDNDEVNWQKVSDYASSGITYDFAPLMDNINWYDTYHINASLRGMGLADMRVVNLMDKRFPARWPETGFSLLPEPATEPSAGIDNRIFTDFEYLPYCIIKPENSYYRFSCYRYKRHDNYLSSRAGQSAVFMKAENDLLMAEALMHLNDLEGAAEIINNGTRVKRGGLEPVNPVFQELEQALFYERNIELFCSAMGIEFFTMRKSDQLQPGTPLHLPIPGKQLELNNLDYYTFGGNSGVPGLDISSGGWY